MTKKQRNQERQIIKESTFDVVLQRTLEGIGDLERDIIALHFKYMPRNKTVYYYSERPVFMRTGVRITTYNGFIFQREIDAETGRERKDETYPKWFGAWADHTLENYVYLGIDVNPKHIPRYFEMLAKMRLAYDFSRENGADIFLPRIFCQLQKQGKTIGILTEDVSLDQNINLEEISEKDLKKQEKIVPLSDVFQGILERSYFPIWQEEHLRRTRELLALVDVDHLKVRETYDTRYQALKKWYEKQNPFVISLDEVK